MGNNLNTGETSSSSGRRCLLVLGMHRSGTSAISRVLALLGADLPEKLMPANGGNETGYWESISVYRLNDEIVASAGSRWDDWLPIDENWHTSPKAGELKARARTALEAEYGTSSFFVLKDPRICRLMPFWLDVFEDARIAPFVVLPLRNPLEVAASLERRDGFTPQLGHLIWLRHVLDAEAGSRGLGRFHCSYDELMSDWPGLVARAEGTLGISWPQAPERAAPEIDAFLNTGLRHHQEAPKRAAEDPALSAWVRETFAILNRWATTGENPTDFAALDRIRAALDDAAPTFAPLVDAGRDATRKVQAAEQSLAEAQNALREAANKITAEKAGLEEEKAARVQTEAELRAALAENELEKEKRTRAETALTAEVAAREQAEAALAARFDEIATLSRLLREREVTARDRGVMEALLAPRALPLLPPPIRVWWQMVQVRRTGLFDAEWYKRTHKDVEASGMDPLRHYVRYGFREGRAPNAATQNHRTGTADTKASLNLSFIPTSLRVRWQMFRLRLTGKFDARWYLATYQDVAASGMDPLLHYVRHGAAEGRAPNAMTAAALRNGASGETAGWT